MSSTLLKILNFCNTTVNVLCSFLTYIKSSGVKKRTLNKQTIDEIYHKHLFALASTYSSSVKLLVIPSVLFILNSGVLFTP